jgi:DNA polymerase-3 subunit alpha
MTDGINKQPVVLHCHSQHSFLDGMSPVKEMVSRVKELGMDSVALTNHGNIFSWVEFYQECKKQNVKPIMGTEAYFTLRHEDKERHAYHLVLLAENQEGLNNIIRLTTRANQKSYYKPRIDLSDLEQYKEGVIALTACLNGPVTYHLFDKMTWPQSKGEESQLKEAANIPKAYEYAQKLVQVMGPNNLFLEVQDGGIDEQKIVNPRIRDLASKIGVKTVATQDFHYVKKEDAKAHAFLKAMAFGKVAAEEGSHGFSTDEFYIKNREEWLEESSLLPEEVDQTRVIASRCNAELQLHKMRLPKYPSDDPRPSIELLKEKLREGWRRRNIKDPKGEYAARVKHELADIESAGLEDYFLIVSDITDYCRDNDIDMSPGRGSAAGSFVSYLLGITQLDPLEYDLIWERFYNVGRKGSMPDIDTDIEKGRRGEVIAYIRERFGDERVAQVVTLLSLGAKQVIRDVLKVAGIDENTKNIIAGLIPAKNEDHGSISLKEAIAAVPKLKEYSEDDKKFDIVRGGRVIRTTSWRELFDIAQRLEGCYKTSGMHAAAVVISDKDFGDAGIPLVKGTNKDDLICGWDMDSIDAMGFLKVDILGLATLDVLKTALKIIKGRHDKEYNLSELPLDDKKVFDLLSNGYNQGVFQLESNLGKSWSKKCKPQSVHEIAELVAIIRPSCLDTGMADTYAKIRNNEEQPSYINPILEPILKPTKGILLFQEQVMAICQKIAGMDLKNADAVRKVIGKKKPEELREKRKEFMDGATKNVSKEVADEIWGWIEKQAGYGFNKSHAVGYAVMAYRTAWVKANYFIEFLCANLMHAKDKAGQDRKPQDVIAQFVNDGKLKDIDVTPPRIESSDMDFSITGPDTISYGFLHIKGVGSAAEKSILACKDAGSFTEFLNLADKNKMNKQVIDAFICAGALDKFGISRRAMKAQYTLWSAITDKEKESLVNYTGDLEERLRALADDSTVDERKANNIKPPNVRRRAKIRELLDEFNGESFRDTVAQILMWEKQYLGATLSGSMADLERAMSGARHTCRDVGSGSLKPGAPVQLCVVVEAVKETTVKRGKTQGRQMAFVTISDSTYSLDGSCVFPDSYDKMKSMGIDVGDIVSVQGTMSDRGLIIKNMRLL